MNSCFEERFQTTSEQNYAKASVQEPVNKVIQKTQYEPKKREETIYEQHHVVIVQAYFRSFLTRKRNKQHFRTLFDNTVTNLGNKWPSVDVLIGLVKKLAFFYDSKSDAQRLIWLSKHIIRNSSELLKSSLDKNVSWYWNLKRIVFFNVDSISMSYSYSYSSFKTSIRVIEEFTLVESYIKILGLNNAVLVLQNLFRYLFCYFKSLRQILDIGFPAILDAGIEFVGPLAKRILELVKRPFSVQSSKVLDEYNSIIMHNFIIAFLEGPTSDVVHKFILPNLSLNQHTNDYIGPDFSLVVMALTHSSTLYEHNTNLFYSLLKLEPTSESYLFEIKCHETGREFNVMYYYLEILSSLTSNLAQTQVFEYINKTSMFKNENKDESETDDSDTEEKKILLFGYSDDELEILKLCSESFNELFRVNRIIKFVEDSLSTEPINYLLVPVCKLCHYLLLSRKSAEHKYRLLYKLSLNTKFLKQLWNTIIRTEEQSLLHLITPNFEKTKVLIVISRGHSFSGDFGRLVSLLAIFCSLFGILVSTLDDYELNYAIGSNPAERPVAIISLLKELALGLIQIAYPDSTTSIVFHTKRINQNADVPSWSHLLQVIFSLLRQLHSRDLHKNFCPEGHWMSSNILFNSSYEKPSTMHFLKFTGLSRFDYRPFIGIDAASIDTSNLNFCPTTPEVRILTVLKEIPFVLPFHQRAVFYQGLIFNNKLRYQYFGSSHFADESYIQVNIRRNYLYEDAFEKLSVENVPELRRKIKINLQSVVGFDEIGVDNGGILREFLSELLKRAFDPNLGFFKMTHDNLLYPNPLVHLVHPNYDDHYIFIGRMLGKALFEDILVDIPLAEFFLVKIIGRQVKVDIRYLESLDPVMFKNLFSLIDYDGDVVDLGLDFTVVNEEFGQIHIEELKPNGANIIVTTESLMEYINLMANYKLNTQISKQCHLFEQGLKSVIPIDLLKRMFSYHEVQVLISGSENHVDIEDLKQHTDYKGGFTSDDPAIILFWTVVNDLTDEQKTKLLIFVTSCSRPPILGFKSLSPRFSIQKAISSDHLPTASTCFNLLTIPAFNDYKILKRKLLYAIESDTGFELL